jgi:hypothetical protein
MKPILSPIQLNETSFNVIRLHQALAFLGHEVSEHERNEHFAGTTTFEKTRALQRSFKITFDEKVLVDAPTATVINRELQSKGLFKDESCSFKVKGAVIYSSGLVAKQQKLLAVDVDLKGAAVYRTMKTVAELKANGGFEILEELQSDSRGNYETIFDCSQFKQAERKKADVVIFALEGETIIGRSRMVNSEQYRETGEVRDLDVTIVKILNKQTEYASVMSRLGVFLSESKVALRELANSADQILFTAHELDLSVSIVRIVVNAEMLNNLQTTRGLSHELLYGIGRQSIPLRWQAIYRKKSSELREAIETSIANNIIQAFNQETISAFLDQLLKSAAAFMLDHKPKEASLALDNVLSHTLPQREQRISFVQAVRTHSGDGPSFWEKYLPGLPEFKDKPELIKGLKTLHQLTLITANHQPLVKELQAGRNISSAKQLIELSDADWQSILQKSGIPENVTGATIEEKRGNYITRIKQIVHAAFPTSKIAHMLKQKELPLEDAAVAKGMEDFLLKNPDFDIRTSRVHKFESQIKTIAPQQYEKVTKELKRVQRLFQVSPTAETLQVLVQHNLQSAHDITNFPKKTFIRTFSGPMGGEDIANSVYQRANFNSARSDNFAMKITEMAVMETPGFVFSESEQGQTMVALQNLMPNYSELFGSPDICECDHCRSVYSPASYFVDLLRFLWRGDKNFDEKTPLDMLAERRPDLLHLPLTCENTNTVIPYIDLANEVMEYYTANDKLDKKAAFDTGDTTAEELRASPQHSNVTAYKKLRSSVYPFTLPYHQPLDVIRTYSEHLNSPRVDVMRNLQIDFSENATRAITAESLGLSPEEYTIVSGRKFNNQPDTHELQAFYGYTNDDDLANLKSVTVFLERTGISYTDLVEIIKTKFINPHQAVLDFLQDIFSGSEMDPSVIYSKLRQIETGNFSPSPNDPLLKALDEVNIPIAAFTTWVQQHLDEFRLVITLYQEDSLCDLNTTKLRTVGRIYTGNDNAALWTTTWTKMHRFIRLWRKLGWTIHETDLLLAALDKSDITPDTIEKISFVSAIQQQIKKPLNEIAVFWGNIDTYGNKSLYKKLFLNKAIQRIDPSFQADEWGNYLASTTEKLLTHQPAILAAFRMSEEDLQAILEVAGITENGARRPLTLDDTLNLPNLSTIYRHVILAKAIKIKVKELCQLIKIFSLSPFSRWHVQQNQFVSINPEATLKIIEIATAVKDAKFKSSVLEYIFSGVLPAESTLGLTPEKVNQTIRTIRESFAAIEQLHADKVVEQLTAETVQGKLANTFQPDFITKLFTILDGTVSLETITLTNLDITIPESLSPKFTYTRGSGRFSSAGQMTNTERMDLKTLPNVTPAFEEAIDRLYMMPELFIRENFGDLFINIDTALLVLLGSPLTLPEKLDLLYASYIPLLKKKLRQDAIIQHIASLIGLTEEITAILIDSDLPSLMTTLAKEGYSATYYSDINASTVAFERVDKELNFNWKAASPGFPVPVDNFSVKWNSYVAVPVSGDYTLIVQVNQPDETFKLYLDDIFILGKAAGDPLTSLEIVRPLNSNQLHKLSLLYTEQSQRAGISLSWKMVTSAPQVIPASFLYPVSIVDSFATLATIYHRASQFISGFKLTETEVGHFIKHKIDFDSINFNALTATHWKRINDYTVLRNRIPQAQTTLIDIFAWASKPGATVTELTELVYSTTAWETTALNYLITNYFNVSVNDFKNEKIILRIQRAIELVQRTGISITELIKWAVPEIVFDELNDTAQSVKSTVKAKYEEADWLSVAGGLSDKIRENQKQALISRLLTIDKLRNWGATDADGLFEYFLIDVQMGACMDTSRIVQANSSVQMFVNRCLLNLESKKSGSGLEHGVAPDSIDNDRWEWMKYYRVWEANRKVFLYPENWLEPEWRDDRSPFFKELESELVQNDITDRSVENAFRNYLTKLNGVANLEVCGSVQEYDDTKNPLLYHVFARTNTIPYQYYYRTWHNIYRKWTAWDKVTVDFRGVDEGDQSNDKNGIHLIPVIWKKRLFIFSPEFIKKTFSESTGDLTGFEAMAEKVSTFASKEYWEIKMAWSEYVDGKWTPKQLTKECAITRAVKHPKSLSYKSQINTSNQLIITGWVSHNSSEIHYFVFDDIQSPVNISYPSDIFTMENSDMYTPDFMRIGRNSKLMFLGHDFLKAAIPHRLQFSNDITDFETKFKYPFFYTGKRRTYFVRPISVSVIDQTEKPEDHDPFIPGDINDDSGMNDPIDIPHYGPEDYREEIVAFGDTGIATITGNPEVGGSTQTFDGGNIAGPNTSVLRNRSTTNESPGTGVIPQTFGGENIGGSTNVVLRNRSVTNDSMATDEFGQNMAVSEYTNEGQVFGEAFGGVTSTGPTYGMANDWGTTNLHTETGLEFHTFFHPYSSSYVTMLNHGSIDGLMICDTMFLNDAGNKFINRYSPDNTYVPKQADFDKRTYYKENVCFDVYGANSIYNWELFFHAPLYIATRLSKNGRYEEAMKWFHYIFNPTTDARPKPGESEISRYWQVLPFKTEPIKDLLEWFMQLDPNNNRKHENLQIGEWRDDPFKPHLVARNRPIAYMKNVVIKYVQNLVDWADSLFRMDTMETVNEALQLYVMANHVLGPRPQFVPKRGEIKAETYTSLKTKWDDFSNALVELENIFPYSSDIPASANGNTGNLLGAGPALYFCIPSNEKLMETWDTVEDRLFKIRHCMNIEGVERKLALFAPPIDPAVLVNAIAQGLSLGSILADLSSPPPIHRFTYLLQHAKEFCGEVKSLGSVLLSVLEKKDAEELSMLRNTHEIEMLNMMTGMKERQILEAKANRENILKTRETAKFRVDHYSALLGKEAISIPDIPTIGAALTADTQLPADTSLAVQKPNVDESLVDSGESGVKILAREKEEMVKLSDANYNQNIASSIQLGSNAVLALLPSLDADAKPLGVGPGVTWGGSNLSSAANAVAQYFQIQASIESFEASNAIRFANFIRREQDWTLQLNLALKEIIQIDKQITAADIRIQITEKDLEMHRRQIENATAVNLFMKNKFTTQEMYQWMKEQLFAVYKQSYNMAYDMAKKTEKAYRFEIGNELTNFIQYGYWDNSKQGLLAGERLQLAIQQMGKSYMEENRRELELTKHLSIALWNPLALHQLKQKGECFFDIPEELFDLDFQGHYYRRIKSVSISVPCVAGPHTTINCSLRLMNNNIRLNTSMHDETGYPHNNDEGAWIDDDRFRSNNTPVKSIATCSAQQDDGLFELSFRDERYLPFEGAGAISSWKLEFTKDAALRQFDYQTISDVVIHLNYTAREDAGQFKQKTVEYLKNYLTNATDNSKQPLMRMFSMKHEFSTAWHKFLYPATIGGEQVLTLTLTKDHFPFFAQNRDVQIMTINVLARTTNNDIYNLMLSATDTSEEPMVSSGIAMPVNSNYGDLQACTLTGNAGGLSIEELDIFSPLSFKLKKSGVMNYTSLGTSPDEVLDIMLLLHYKLA